MEDKPVGSKGQPLRTEALAMVMRDVLAGMGELATCAAFTPTPCDFEILDAPQPQPRDSGRATVLPHPTLDRQRDAEPPDISAYLIRRELTAS